MNFVKSTETFQSTNVAHMHSQYQTLTNSNRPAFHHGAQRFGGPQHEHAAGQWQQQQFVPSRFNGPQGLLNGLQFGNSPQGFPLQGFGNVQQQQFGNFQQQGFGSSQQENFGGLQPGFIARQRYRGPQPRFGSPSDTFCGQQSGFSGPHQRFSGPSQRFSRPPLQTRPWPQSSGSQYGSFVKPEKQEDQFEGGLGTQPGTGMPQGNFNRPSSAPQGFQRPHFSQDQPGNAGRGTDSFKGRGGGFGQGAIGRSSVQASSVTSSNAASMNAAIPDDNLGKKLLQKMGWTGGGIGKDGTGIEEPVAMKQVIKREGLGLSTAKRGGGSGDNTAGVLAATAAAAQATREAIKHDAKVVWLANQDGFIAKMKHLATEVKGLKTERPNAIDKLHSAANRALVKIQCEIESGPIVKGTGTFFCLVQFDGVNVSVSSALNKRTAKIEAFEIALQKIMMPNLRVVEIDGTAKELQSSNVEWSNEPLKQTVVKPTSAVVAAISADGQGSETNAFQKESNVEAIVNIKKRNYTPKDLSEFLLVEPQEHNSSVNGASILRRSADYSKMLLEYEFAAHGNAGAVRCIVRVEGQVLASVVAGSKPAAKIKASQEAVDYLRQHCWTILTKQHHDTDAPEITKDEMFSDLASSVTSSNAASLNAASLNAASLNAAIPDDNLGKKLLQKMGWTGGGIGKDGTGIEEPVAMKQVINREGLGLSTAKGITRDFRQRITDMLETYTASERQDDLVFSPAFRKDERIIIHNECRRLNLKSTSKGQGGERFLIVRRKRSANQLLEHVMACGGETARYKIVPPGQRNYPWQRIPHVVGVGMPGPGSKASLNMGTVGSASVYTNAEPVSGQDLGAQSAGIASSESDDQVSMPGLGFGAGCNTGMGLLGPAPNMN